MNAVTPTTESIPIRLRLWLEGAGLLRILMIAIWVTSWYQVLMGSRIRWGAALLVLVAVLAGSYTLTRLFSRLNLPPARARLFFLLWLIASLALSLQTMVLATNAVTGESLVGDLVESVKVSSVDFGIFVHLIVVMVLAWRGIALAQGPMDQGEAMGSFQIGILAFLLYGFLFGRTLPPVSFIPVYAFLLVALVGLATARITDLATARGGRLPGSFVNWWLPILAAAAAVTALALFSGWLVGNQAGKLAVIILAAFVILLMVVSAIVALPVLALVYLALPWLQRLFAEGLELMPIQSPNEIADQIFGEELNEIAQSVTGIDQSYILLLGIILITIIAVVIFSLRSRTQKRQYTLQEDEAASLANQHRRGAWQPGDSPWRRSFGRPSNFFNAVRIRRCYWELMRMAAQLGTPRPPAATPLEYLPLLDTVFPDQHQNLRQVTSAYLQVRYGETPETESEVRQVSIAWESIRKEGRKLLRDRRAAQRQKRAADS